MVKCEVPNCERNAIVAFGTKWVCGKCCVKLLKKKQEKDNKLLEEI